MTENTELPIEEVKQSEKEIKIVDYVNFFSHIFYPHYNRPEQYGISDLWNKYGGDLYNTLSACQEDKVVGITFEFFGRTNKEEILKEVKKGLCLVDYFSFNFTEQVCSSLFTDANHLWKIWKSNKGHPAKYFGMIGEGERTEKIVKWLEGCSIYEDVFNPVRKVILDIQPTLQKGPQKRGIRSSATAFAQMNFHSEPESQQPNKNGQNQFVSGLSVSGRSKGPPKNGVRSFSHIVNIFNSAQVKK